MNIEITHSVIHRSDVGESYVEKPGVVTVTPSRFLFDDFVFRVRCPDDQAAMADALKSVAHEWLTGRLAKAFD